MIDFIYRQNAMGRVHELIRNTTLASDLNNADFNQRHSKHQLLCALIP